MIYLTNRKEGLYMHKKNIVLTLLATSLLSGCSAPATSQAEATSTTTHEYHCRTINYYDYSKPVPATDQPIEDAYFQDTFFGGDSRMGSVYLYSGLRDKGAQVWYCESLSLYRVYDMLNPDMQAEFGDASLYTLLTTTQKQNIYIFLGINEIRSDNFDAWKETYSSIIDEIKKNNPTCHIYIMSSYHPRSISGLTDEQVSEHVKMVNDAMQSMASEHHIYYYNTDDGMIDASGLVKTEWVWDGLHLNVEGAQAFGDQIARHVVKEETYVKKICE